jgi:hypothetical protein
VIEALHPMKFSPLIEGEWTEERVVENLDATARQIVEAENDERPGAVFRSRLRPGRVTPIDHPRESFERPGVSQAKMPEDFARRRSGGNAPTPLLGRQARQDGFDLLPQSSEMRVQAGYSRFAIFQLECCRTNNLKKLNQEGCHENG